MGKHSAPWHKVGDQSSSHLPVWLYSSRKHQYRGKYFQVLLLKHKEIKLSNLDIKKKPDVMKFDINLRIRILYLDKDLYLSNFPL